MNDFYGLLTFKNNAKLVYRLISQSELEKYEKNGIIRDYSECTVSSYNNSLDILIIFLPKSFHIIQDKTVVKKTFREKVHVTLITSSKRKP